MSFKGKVSTIRVTDLSYLFSKIKLIIKQQMNLDFPGNIS